MFPGADESLVSPRINNIGLAASFNPIVKIITRDSSSCIVRFIDPIKARNCVVWVGMVAAGLADAGYSNSQKYFLL